MDLAQLSILDPSRTKFGVFDPSRNSVEPGFGLGPALDFCSTFGRGLTSPVAARKLAAGAFLSVKMTTLDLTSPVAANQPPAGAIFGRN